MANTEEREFASIASEFQKRVELAKSQDWRAAARQFAETTSHPEYQLEYVTNEARADFRFLLPIDGDSTVLDIGSGWGNIATAFARTCGQAFALDVSLEHLQMVQVRARQEGLSNVVPFRADATHLPIPPGSLDIALMVGVLEWVAWGRNDGAPKKLQSRALGEILDALKPGGTLYIGIENRFGFNYLLGSRDPHTGLRFITILPRVLANLYSLAARKRPYREWTYSLRDLNNLLHQAGFEDVRFLFPIPNYQNFRFIVDYAAPGTSRFVLNRLGSHARFTRWHYIAGRAASILHLERWLSPCFSVLARRPM
ncbi:MAG: class I SAM-dependent methyltransferase [Chloroflexia bacterium]|nr:class I SAM-dependent methyltransferase [Chloroflexia bacterium]